MKHWAVMVIYTALVLATATACSSTPSQEICAGSGFKENSVKARSSNPNRIDFDVCGEPSSLSNLSAEDQRLPRHLQFGRLMRPYAEKRLVELKLCPNGFAGPEIVQRPKNNLRRRFFWVDCIT